MKTRNGFVSNSSSSSFICDICDGVENGYDASLSDFEMLQCVNGHEWHQGCNKVKLDNDESEILKMFKDFALGKIHLWGIKLQKEDIDIINDANSLSELEVRFTNYDKIYDALLCSDNGIPEFLCPICKFISITKNDILQYLIKSSGFKNIDEVHKDMQMGFKNYNEFKDWLKE